MRDKGTAQKGEHSQQRPYRMKEELLLGKEKLVTHPRPEEDHDYAEGQADGYRGGILKKGRPHWQRDLHAGHKQADDRQAGNQTGKDVGQARVIFERFEAPL